MNLLAIVSLLTYTFGIFAFGSIFVFWARALADPGSAEPCPGECPSHRYDREDGVGGACRAANLVTGALTLLCTVWFVIQLALLFFELSPNLEGGWLGLARLLLVFLFPPLIMQTTFLDVQLPRRRPLRHRAWTAVLWLVWLATPVLPAYTLLAVFDVVETPHGFGAVLGFAIGVAFLVAGVFSLLAVKLGRPGRETADQRAGRRSMMSLYIGLILFCLLIVAANIGGAPSGEVFNFIGGSIPLFFAFTSLYHEARFRFVDVFVKRGLFLFATIALLTLFFALVFPPLAGFEPASARPWLSAVALLPLALALPWIRRRFAQWVDGVWLGRNLAPTEAIKCFLSDIGAACTETDLVREAERGLTSLFQAPVRVNLMLNEAPRVDFDCVLEVPIAFGGRRVGGLLMGRRANHMPYFSQDLTLLSSLADVFSYMLENIRLQQRRQEQEKLARELSLQASRSELRALRAQINPHFLFNALNAIAGLIHRDPFRADQTVEQLAEVFRYTLRGSQSEWATLEEELDFVRSYLEVEQARFSRLQVGLITDPSVTTTRVPTMLVHTLVENAVKHGIARVRGPARIEVVARRAGDRLVIDVADSGPGFPAQEGRQATPSRGAGYGLRNVRERLAGHFGDRAGVRTRRDEERGLTVVSIVLPLESAAASAGEDAAGSHGVA